MCVIILYIIIMLKYIVDERCNDHVILLIEELKLASDLVIRVM